MEKADILEMTVKHLKNLQNRLSATKSHTTGQLGTNNAVVNKYKAGYKECAEEVHRYLDSVPAVHPAVKDHLNVHLNTCSGTLEPTTSSVPCRESVHSTKTVNGTRIDSMDSIAVERALPMTGVQIGIPLVSGNGSPQSLVLSGAALSSIQTPQGYVPVLISPGSGSSIGSGISVVSPPPQQQASPSSVQSGVIPLYSSGHMSSSGARSPSLESTSSSIYSSPQSSPPSSPISHNDASITMKMQMDYENYPSKSLTYSNVKALPVTHQSRLHQKNMFVKDSVGQDMYRYSKEVLVQPNSGHVWRPW